MTGWLMAAMIATSTQTPSDAASMRPQLELILKDVFVQTGPEAMAALWRLQKDGARASAELTERYGHTAEKAYFERWMTVHAMVLIGHPSSRAFFRDVLAKPVSADGGDACDVFCPSDRELTVRLEALQGLGALSFMGDVEASTLLLAVVTSHPDPRLRRGAAAAFVEYARDQATARRVIQSSLPQEDLSPMVKPVRQAEAGPPIAALPVTVAAATCLCDVGMPLPPPFFRAPDSMSCDAASWGSNGYATGDYRYTRASCAWKLNEVHAVNFEFTDTWDGFGRSLGCNEYTPYGRTLNAMTALVELSARVNQGPNYINYYEFAASRINQTNAACWSGHGHDYSAEAAGAFYDDEIAIFSPFFGDNVVERAAILVHEARHIDRHSVFAQPEAHVDCAAHLKWCDYFYSNSHSLSDDSAGAYSYQVWVLEAFARDTRLPRFLRAYAVRAANGVLKDHFATPTDYEVRAVPTEGCVAGAINTEGGPFFDECAPCPSGLADQRHNTCLPPCQVGMMPNAGRDGCVPSGALLGAACANSMDCSSRSCVDGRCRGHVRSGGWCGADDCEVELSCMAGRCIPRGGLASGNSCSVDAQCSSRRCSAQRCVPRPDLGGPPLSCYQICSKNENPDGSCPGVTKVICVLPQ